MGEVISHGLCLGPTPRDSLYTQTMASPHHHGGPPLVEKMDPLSPPQPQSMSEENIHVELTHEPLSITGTLNRVRSPKAGALVLFAGLNPCYTRFHFFSKILISGL